jgi:Holliday junction resolvasome RuvABC endonuclease subunit
MTALETLIPAVEPVVQDGSTSRIPNIIGLDLSIAAPGFADINGATHTVKLKASLGDRRLNDIAREAVRLATGHPWRTDLAVIEDLPTHAHGAGITGMVHGAVRAALNDLGVPYVTVPPASLKKYATGKGNADKTAMAIAALKRFGLEFADDNCCDAYWLRAMGLHAYRHPLVDLPVLQADALGKIAWPLLADTSTIRIDPEGGTQ